MVTAPEVHSSESKSGLAFARYQRNNFLKKASKLGSYLTRDRRSTYVMANTTLLDPLGVSGAKYLSYREAD